MDRVQQILIADGFSQELDRTGLHGPNRHRDIGVATDEDNRQVQICLGQLVLKIKPTSPRQPDIEHQASRNVEAGGRASSSVTGMRYPIGRYRHGELKDAPLRRVWRGPKAAAMGFDNRAADREPHAHSFGLRCEEGIENAVHFRCIEPHARIRDRDQHIAGLIPLGAYPQHPWPMHDAAYRLDPVYDQV